MKTLTIVLLASLGLGGCVAVPAYDAYGPGYAPAPFVVQPAISFGFGFRGGDRGHHRHGRR